MKLSDMLSSQKEESTISLNLPPRPNSNRQSVKIFNPFLLEAMGGKEIIVESCHICNVNFSLIKKKYTCKECQEPTCKEHLVVQSRDELDRICDKCMHERLLKQRLDADQEIKDQIMNDIIRSKEVRESRTQLLHKESTKEKALRKELNEIYNKTSQEEENLNKKLAEESEEKQKLNEELQRIKGQLDATKYTENATTRWMGKVKMELDDKRNKMIEKNKEINELESNYLEIRDFIQTMVPVRLVEQVVCRLCLQKVKHAYVKMFSDAIDEEKIPAPSNRRPEVMKRDLCACFIF
ncbi:unnamed protein product [Blepharisma stoltei]|uniref:FYVE-type domain-containing protein n=1 Tax=Blepharisma stoltei TaxID=1481888 RepID=A0AAU9J2Y9_9CILI|nr:unnamed protein product [Blepharisma stoltei]